METQRLSLKSIAARMRSLMSQQMVNSCQHRLDLQTWRCTGCGHLTWVMKTPSTIN